MSAWLAALFLLAARSPAQAPEPQRFQNVQVKPGDTLWSIANRYLMDPARWDEILKHNKLPSSDPTVALPGMSLRVPVRLIKSELRAAEVVYVLNKVDSRKRETAAWKSVKEADQVFEGDSVRTREGSKAKVRFINADMLNVDADSLVIIKPPKADYDVELKRGGVFVGRSRVVTASARITPRTQDTEYSAKVRQDLSTLVEVYKGQASVDAQGKTVDVSAGMATEVKLGLAPAVPVKIADLPEFEARAAEFSPSRLVGQSRPRQAEQERLPQAPPAAGELARDIDSLNGDMRSLSIGMPVAGYRVQASRSQQFSQIVFDKTFDVDEKIYLKDALPPGVYWWRIAMIDLLGTEGAFSAPRLYALGVAAPKARLAEPQEAVVLTSPRKDETVGEPDYQVKGLAKQENVSVFVNERPVRMDEAGNFQETLKLAPGSNKIVVRVTDAAGASTVLTRFVTYVPRRP